MKRTIAGWPAALERFYSIARPPGFWGPIARRLGEDPRGPRRRLARGLAATALATLALFALLVGVGTALVGAPAPSLLPQRGAFVALCLALGCGLTPLWWHLGFRGRR